jgi:outer membrane protein
VNISQYVYAILIIGVTLHTPLNAADLMDVYRDALEHDAEYAAARAAHMAAQEKLPQGRAGLLPTLTLAGVRRRQLIDTNRGSEVTIDNTSLVITAIQPLFRMENFIAYEQSKIQVMQADSQFIIAAQVKPNY